MSEGETEIKGVFIYAFVYTLSLSLSDISDASPPPLFHEN